MNQENLKPNIDLANTTAMISPDGNQLFAEGVILRKVSKFVTGTTEDGLMPIPVFYDVKTGEILLPAKSIRLLQVSLWLLIRR